MANRGGNMRRSRRLAAVVLATGGLACAVVPASAMAVTATVDISPSVSLLGDPIGGLQTVISGVVSATTNALCTASANNSTVCSLQILSYAVATDYVKPGGGHVTKVTGAVINLPTLVDVTGDLLPDLTVTVTAVSTDNVKLDIKRALGAPATMPVSVEALVADPGSANGVINVGYDARQTTAPTSWTANASITTGTAVKVAATLSTSGAPSSMAVLGGVFTEGAGGARLDPKQARMNYTPVPATAGVTFELGPDRQTGTVSAGSPTKADLEMLLMSGADGTHVTGTLDKLQQPLGLVLDRVDDTGQPTTAASGHQHVRLTTKGDVAKANLTYESITASQVLQRLRLAADQLPGQTDFTQTTNGILIDTDTPIAKVAGGVSRGVPAGPGQSAVPVPAAYPLESAEASYVHQDTTGGVDSTTFRVNGVQHVSVESTGAQDDRVIAIGARLAAGPLHALLTNDAAPGGTRYDADIADVPHNFTIRIAPSRVRKLEFCGSSSDASDPCGSTGQAAPAGIASIVLHPSYSPKALFGRATRLSGAVTGIPSTLGLDLATHAPTAGDPDTNTMVHIDTTRAIGRVLLRGTDGSAPPADPADNGIVYVDQPGKPYAVIAKIDGIRSIHLDTSPKLAVALTAAAGHDLSYGVHLPPDPTETPAKPARDFDGVVEGRPATTEFSLDNPADGPLKLHVGGADAAGNPAGTGRITLNALHLSDQPAEKTHNVHVDLSGVPAAIDLVRQPSTVQDALDLAVTTSGGPLGSADVQLDNDVLPAASEIPALPAGGGGAIVISGGGRFFVHAHVLKLRGVDLKTKPSVDATIDAADPQDFRIYLNTGVGDDPQANPNDCPDFHPNDHNPQHVEYHDVYIKALQPNTHFGYTSGTDGNPDPCKVKSNRRIEYSAAGRADSITYDTDAGDLSHLHAVIGQDATSPLKVPQHLTICQAGDDECFGELGRSVDCRVLGVHYDYCSTTSADQTIYIEPYGQRTHMHLDFCSLNDSDKDPALFDRCGKDTVNKGVFVDLNLSHLDVGYHFKDGLGFLAMNTDGQPVDGYLRAIDHLSTGEYINLNFGYDTDAGPAWAEGQGSHWDDYFGAIAVGAPLVGTKQGDATCVNAAYGASFNDWDSYFHVILKAAGADEGDLGDNLTNLICGLF